MEGPARSGGAFRRPRWALPALFSTTAFVGAGLLFVVQPLVARIILPSYGGSATVWSTSSLFFQVLLLLAYLYAHVSTRRFGPRWQPRLHLVVLALPLLALPVVVPTDAAPPEDSSPVLWLLRTLLLVIGLPFAMVATTGPLLQRWYSWNDAYRRDDPYFLFAASNLGSFGGLLAYPFLIEPHLTVAQQRAAWSSGLVAFMVLMAVCAVVTSLAASEEREPAEVGALSTTGLGGRTLLRWIGLAFLPSSLMLGVTSHLSTDVAAIPLLWVVPLAIYLATFVLAFARTSRVPPLQATRVAVALTMATVVAVLTPGALPLWMEIGLPLAMLAAVGFAAHARLAAERPAPEHLTAFFLVVSVGGALGGLLNGLVAPVTFDRILELPIALSAVPLLLVGARPGDSDGWLERQLRANRVRAALVVLTAVMIPLVVRAVLWLGGESLALALAGVAVVAVAAWLLSAVPRTLVVALVLVHALAMVGDSRGLLEQTRSFFGTYKVRALDGTHQLVHGTTIHGTQLDARPRLATTYYAPTGPLGDAMTVAAAQDVAAVGLGAGTIAAYGREGQSLTFFEIDPLMREIASDPRFFTYLADSEADVDTVIGDGRLALAEQPEGSYDLIVLDAFSSDSIPVHLLTEEAMDVYASRLTEDGLLLVHISNRVFDLEPVLAADAAHLGWSAVVGQGRGTGRGEVPATWVALSPDTTKTERLLVLPGWKQLERRPVAWTDDYSSILSVLR